MGREVQCECRWGEQTGHAKALLESREIILRGAIKRRAAIAHLSHPRVEGDALLFEAGQDQVVLHVGAAEAARWHRAITTEPPSLATKLGLSVGRLAWVIGDIGDTALGEAVAGATTPQAGQAAVVVAETNDARALVAALESYRAAGIAVPIWIVHGKGRGVAFGEAPVRDMMRAAGFMDTKVAAVSLTRSATRYSRQT